MNQKEQIQLAFEIWDRMAHLESALWDQYYHEFLDIIMDEEDAKLYQTDDQIDAPF